MKRFWSMTAALLLGLVTAVGLAAPATAVGDGCSPDDGYWPDAVCALTVEAVPYCSAGTPLLDYVAVPEGTDSEILTITWLNPTGDDVVQAGLPLSGTVPWPQTPWAAGTVEVEFHVNPTTVVTVVHPAGTACRTVLTSTSGTTALSAPVGAVALSETGSELAPLVAGAVGLVGLGLVTLLLARRRRAGA